MQTHLNEIIQAVLSLTMDGCIHTRYHSSPRIAKHPSEVSLEIPFIQHDNAKLFPDVDNYINQYLILIPILLFTFRLSVSLSVRHMVVKTYIEQGPAGQ